MTKVETPGAKETPAPKATDAARETAKPEEERSAGQTRSTALAQKKVVPPQELTDEEINTFVTEINLEVKKIDTDSLTIGLKVYDRVFDRNLANVQDKNPLKKQSFAKIARHKDLSVDSTTLSKWVRAAASCDALKQQGKTFEYLTCSHYFALFRVEDMSKRVALAEEAENQKLSVRNLQKRIKKSYPPEPAALSVRIARSLANPGALVNDDGLQAEMSDLEALRQKLGESDLEHLGTKIKDQRKLMKGYLQVLDRLDANLNKIAADMLKKAA